MNYRCPAQMFTPDAFDFKSHHAALFVLGTAQSISRVLFFEIAGAKLWQVSDYATPATNTPDKTLAFESGQIGDQRRDVDNFPETL